LKQSSAPALVFSGDNSKLFCEADGSSAGQIQNFGTQLILPLQEMLVVQDNTQEGIVDADFAVIFNEA
jgi:hypothetical protein